MQRLATENAQMHRERWIYWALTALVVGFQVYTLVKGAL
jgi:hypothetical protein